MFNTRSYSDLDTFARCPKQYKYKVIDHLQPKMRSVALYQGIMAHEALMTYYLGNSVPEYFDDQAMVDIEYLFDDELAERDTLLLDTEDLVFRYLDNYQDNWEVLHVEEQFIITLTGGEVVSFTPDLIVRDGDGGVWIVDHKTTISVPANDGLPFADLQALLYYAGVKSIYPDLQGFVFNYLRKKRPVELRMNKTMGKDGIRHVNNVMKADTTYKKLRNFLEVNAPELLDMEMYRRRLAELRDTDRFFWRETITFSDDEAQSAVDDANARIMQIKYAEENDLFPRTLQKTGVKACERCGFRRLCQGEMLNWNTQLILDEDYEPRDPKNVYESED